MPDAASEPEPREPSPSRKNIDIALNSGVATILLDRPDIDNAWSLEMSESVGAALGWCDATDEVDVVVIGARGRAFSVGADLATGHLEEAPPTDAHSAVEDHLLPSQIRKPVIAALQGHAVGAGMTFALHCDLRIVAEDAKFGFPFVRRGLVPEFCSTWLLPRVIGMACALELLLSGRLVSGSEAVSMGLAHRSTAAQSVLEEAQAWAALLTNDGSPLAMAATKRLLWSGATSSPDEHAARELSVFRHLASSDDGREGITAFLEKRRPSWTSSLTHRWPAGL